MEVCFKDFENSVQNLPFPQNIAHIAYFVDISVWVFPALIPRGNMIHPI